MIDTDSLVLLCGLKCLKQALDVVGYEAMDCRRLSHAPKQIRKSRWFRRQFPHLDREEVAQKAEAIPSLELPRNIRFQQKLIEVEGIDEGETLLLATAEEQISAVLLSGDQRMLRAFGEAKDAELAEARNRLRGRLLYLPQVIRALVQELGLEEMDSKWRSANIRHKSLAVLFGSQPIVSANHFQDAYEYLLSDLKEVFGEDYFYNL